MSLSPEDQAKSEDLKKRLPSFMMNAYELTELWGYANVRVLYDAISKGRFPIPTYKHGKFVVADTEVVKAYFSERRKTGVEKVSVGA